MWHKHKIISLFLSEYVNTVFDNYPKDILDVLNKTYYEIDHIKTRCAGDFTYIITSPNDIHRTGEWSYNKTQNKSFKINLKNVDELYCGKNHGFAITDNHNALYCWGQNFCGQLGVNDRKISYLTPLKIEFTEFHVHNIKKIVCGEEITFVLLTNGTIFRFGTINSIIWSGVKNNTPILLDLPLSKDIGCYSDSAFVVTNDGFVYCWGGNTSKQLGIDSNDYYITEPTKMKIKNAEKVICGAFHTFVITTRNVGYCFGSNSNGRLMYNGTTPINEPKLFNMGAIKDICCSDNNTYVITKKGNLLSWGRNYEGQLGIGITDQLPRYDPLYGFNPKMKQINTLNTLNKPNVVNIKNVHSISCGDSHVFVTTNDGLYCWGQNTSGQLGLNHFDNQNAPQKYTTFLF
jgi:alpha-tubulin suppressor-like RCC1 family protein